MSKKTKTIEWWNEIYHENPRILSSFVTDVIEYAKIKDSEFVLDVGSGIGKYTEAAQ